MRVRLVGHTTTYVRLMQGMFEVCNAQATLGNHEAYCEHWVQHLLKVFDMQARLLGFEANRMNLPKGRLGARNVLT